MIPDRTKLVAYVNSLAPAALRRPLVSPGCVEDVGHGWASVRIPQDTFGYDHTFSVMLDTLTERFGTKCDEITGRAGAQRSRTVEWVVEPGRVVALSNMVLRSGRNITLIQLADTEARNAG